MKRRVVALSGASGMIYAVRLVEWLVRHGHRIDLLVSRPAEKVFALEIGRVPADEKAWRKFFSDRRGLLKYHALNDFNSPLASGSVKRDAMIIVPCSMGLVGRIAAGVSGNLLERAADIMLKERRPLVLVFRETPLSLIHLENLTNLSRAGAIVMPAAPGFYSRPKDLNELADGLVGRILKQVGIENNLEKEWGNGD